MADIFLSYAREDLEQARRLAEVLQREGWSVFWDRTTPPGVPWDEYIEDALDDARCVVVVWSRESVRSRWVREEARRGQSRLVPVLLDDVERLPLGLGSIQAADLAAWDGSADKPEYQSSLDPPWCVGAARRQTGRAHRRAAAASAGGR